jgi:hypothetical protein
MLKSAAVRVGRAVFWLGRVIGQLGGALNGGRNADTSAAKIYERPRDEYRP